MLPDNLNYTEPVTGKPVATDFVSGAHYQRMKLDVGPEGRSIPVTGTAAYGVPADVRSTSIDTVSTSGIQTSPKWAPINITSAGDAIVVPAVAGRRIRVLAISFCPSKNMSVSFKSGIITQKIPPMLFNQGQPFDVNRMPFGFFVETDPGDSFVINLSTNGNLAGSITYIEA